MIVLFCTERKLRFTATVGEEPEAEVTLVQRLRTRALLMGLRAPRHAQRGAATPRVDQLHL